MKFGELINGEMKVSNIEFHIKFRYHDNIWKRTIYREEIEYGDLIFYNTSTLGDIEYFNIGRGNLLLKKLLLNISDKYGTSLNRTSTDIKLVKYDNMLFKIPSIIYIHSNEEDVTNWEIEKRGIIIDEILK